VARLPCNGATDHELLDKSSQDAEAFGVLYDRHVEVIHGYFIRWTGSKDVAADLTAETFAAAWASRHRYRADGPSALPWIFGIARHQLLRMFRTGRVMHKAQQKLGLQPLKSIEEGFERVEERVDAEALTSQLREALRSLPRAVAEAVVLRVALGHSYPEIARELGCSEGAARVRVTRGLRQLSVLMRKGGP
jgi:RNA polymerase sigma factor (sigma-70 family)